MCSEFKSFTILAFYLVKNGDGMFYKTTLIWLLTLGLSSIAPAFANIPADSTVEAQDEQASSSRSDENLQNPTGSPHLPEVLKRILVPGMNVSQQFTAQSGLTGWVLSSDDNHTLVYTTADEQTLITGTLLDNQGNNLSEFYTKRYLPEADFALLAQAHSIAQHSVAQNSNAEQGETEPGQQSSMPPSSTQSRSEQSQNAHDDGSSALYVFFDPNCPFCHFAWQALEVYQQQGAEIRWIPVAYLQPDSRIKAAAVLQAKHPAQVLRASMLQQAAWPMSEKEASKQSDQALSFNMQLMKRFALQGTPAFVWLDSEQQLQSYSGMPKLATFAEMTGQDEQQQKAPELARFR